MSNQKYTFENTNKLIELWAPRLIGFNLNINGQTVTVTELSTEKIGEYYEIWVETDSLYRDDLTDVIHGNLEFLSIHHTDITD